ncbi:hypothetical protein UFOVP150_34 [uncultured Caudovirales phage]|uniref:Uncharacterized protein n=1 Tax=uncultured Caudovirales phage TaxID=2100421 RepID=A0A6J7W808_9CAUD|nr:hypothetical protein UFOVP150_34 [uncultured Caudovirales phage]
MIPQSHINATCEIICREAIANMADGNLRFSYAGFLLDKQVQLAPSEREAYIRVISEMLGD